MKQWILGAILGLVLAACGGGASVPPPAAELAELLTNADQADAEVRLEVLRSFKPATISTQFNPFIGGLTVYEIAGTTPKGLPFKAVALGDEGLEPEALRGQLRMKARIRRIQGQVVLAGWLVPRDPNSTLNPIAFIAAAQNANFRGPAAGTVYQFSGMAEFKGVCEEKGLSGSYSLKQGNLELVGALTGVKAGATLGCTPGEVEEQSQPIALSYTAVETHMGTLFSFQGSLAPGAGGASVQGQVLSPMPSQGLTLAPTTLPASSLLATATLKSNVKELGNVSGAELVSFDQDNGTLIFNRLAGNLRELAVGDIVSSAPRTAAPNGFLRRVTSIENTGDGKVRVRTVKADLADLLDEGDIQMDLPLSEADIQRATALQRGQIIYAAQQLGPSAQAQITRNFGPIEVVEGVTVSGFVRFDPRIVVKFNCRKAFCSEPYFLAKFVLNERAEVRLNATLEKTLKKSIQIARIPLGTITAGPLVFLVEVVFTVDVEGKLRVELEVGAWQELELQAGVEYNKNSDGQWKKINDITKKEKGIIGPTLEGSAELKAGVYGALRLMLYGVAGVSAEVGPYVQFNAQYPSQPYWTMKYGLEGNLGVDIDLIVFRKDWEVPLFDIELFNEQAPNSPPKFDDIGPKYVCDSGYAARNASNRVVLFASTDDKEDGPGTGTIQWRRGNNLLGTTRKADKHTLEVELPNGTHTITATLTDSQQASRTRSFEVRLAANECRFPNGLPVVNIVSNSDEGPIVLPYSTNLTARTWPFSQAGCPTHELGWRSNLQRRSLGSTNGVFVPASGSVGPFCEHSFEVRKMADRQVITARFNYNGLTVKDTTEVLPSRILSLNIGGIQYSAPSNSRYIYVGDQVNFSVSGDNPVWSSSEPSDNINGRTGNSVNARFNTAGPRTIVAQVSDGNGGFASKSIIVYVYSGLFRP